MDKIKLKELIVEHKERALKPQAYFPRKVSAGRAGIFSQKEIHVITGVRRSGKSTLMRLLMQHLVERSEATSRQILYLNFEDERFVGFEIADFQRLYETFLSLEQPEGRVYFFLDEIQNIQLWEKWVNRVYELYDVKIFLTGSNATMLSGEIASALTGRNRIVELYPFSFFEFVQAKGWQMETRDYFRPEIRASLTRLFDEYINTGGFPEPVKTGDTSILQDYFRDILYRDIVARYGVKRVRELKELGLYLSSNLGSLMSLKRLKDMISVRSMTTVKNFVSYFSETYLFFPVNLFSYSLKKQIYNPAKIYCIDHALASEVGFRFSADLGRTLENIVCVELKRRGHEIFYWRDEAGSEVDFVVRQGLEIVQIIQVCHAMETETAKQREMKGLLTAARKFDLQQALIVTSDTWRQEIIDGVQVDILPIWKWLLEDTEAFDVPAAL